MADMHPEDVKALIRKSGWRLTDLSRENGLSPGAVQKALRQPWPRVEQIIGAHLGLRPQDIWPSRYHADGRSRTQPRQPRRPATEAPAPLRQPRM